jgi:hypothetical protein
LSLVLYWPWLRIVVSDSAYEAVCFGSSPRPSKTRKFARLDGVSQMRSRVVGILVRLDRRRRQPLEHGGVAAHPKLVEVGSARRIRLHVDRALRWFGVPEGCRSGRFGRDERTSRGGRREEMTSRELAIVRLPKFQLCCTSAFPQVT